jgi:putative transcriptional regulator
MITSSKDILLSLGTESAPELYVIALGHASWAPGQLEEELQENLWLTTAVDTDIIFNTPIEQRWKKATASLGIDIAHLSSDVGHA